MAERFSLLKHYREEEEKRRAERKKNFEQFLKDNPEKERMINQLLQDLADEIAKEPPTTIEWLRGVMNAKQAEREKARGI